MKVECFIFYLVAVFYSLKNTCSPYSLRMYNTFPLYSAGEKISGIQYNPESIHGMRENLERILQFMAAKRIRMHQITSKEILEGNLKAVMRLILALAAHYKPQSVRHHHDVSYESIGKGNYTRGV